METRGSMLLQKLAMLSTVAGKTSLGKRLQEQEEEAEYDSLHGGDEEAEYGGDEAGEYAGDEEREHVLHEEGQGEGEREEAAEEDASIQCSPTCGQHFQRCYQFFIPTKGARGAVAL